jgi:hypothetical protein
MKDKKKTLLEAFENLSGWVKGIIGLLTALVSFVFLFRDNTELMVMLIVVTTSISAMIAAWYILTAKTAPLIEGGKGVFKYANMHSFAKIAIFLIPVIDLVFFSSNYGKEVFLISVFGMPKETKTMELNQSTPALTDANEANIIETPSLTATLSPLDLINIEFSSQGCVHAYWLPEDSRLPEDPFVAAQKYYSITTSKGFAFESFDFFVLGGPLVLIKATNQQAADGSWIKIDNKISISIDSVTPLEHLDIGIFSWGRGVTGGYMGFGCGGGGNVQYLFPKIRLDNQRKMFTSQHQDFDYFSVEPGEFYQFSVAADCGATGIYKFHVVMNVSYADQEREFKSSPYYAYCPESYTEWWFHDVAQNGDMFDVHTVSNAGTFAPNASWDYVLSRPGWTITKPWKPCLSAPESIIFPDPNSKRPIVNPEENSSVNVRLDPSISSAAIEKLPPGYKDMRIIDGPACADDLVWWKVELNAFSNVDKPRVTGWVAEGDESEKWLIVQREIPNIHFTPEP